jgi:endonuclease YncB( thermonuclease family)
MRLVAIFMSQVLGLLCGDALASELTGTANVSDGDTITVAGTKVRLEGIDAPETDQICLNGHGAKWTCGIEARDRLSGRIGGREISCRLSGVDRYGRSLGVCYVDDVDLNGWMAREGWALAFVRYSQTYASDEAAARVNERGLWKGAFVAPWDWRHRGPHTVVLGSLSVPLKAQTALLAPASSEGAPSAECVIKGNVNRNGERIFHVPGQIAYAHVNMAGGGKRWFCSTEEAEAAGWRPAVR